MNKKILIITQYYYPEQFMITDIAENLYKIGNNVTVLTGIPNYPLGKKMNNYKNKFQNEIINGVKVKRVPMILRGKGLKMILNYFSYALMSSLALIGLEKDYDIIFVYEVSPVTQIFPGFLYKRLKNKNVQLIVNCQDIWPEVLKTYGFDENSLVFKIGKKISLFLYRKADKILISSPMFEDYLTEIFKISQNKIEYLPNYAEDWVLQVENKQPKDGKIHFLFAGNMGTTQNLSLIIRSIGQCKCKNKIIIDFVGNGSEMNSLAKLTTDLNLQDIIIFHGRKNKSELKYYYDITSAFLLTLKCDNKVCYTIPSKVQGYMGAGKPIIASILGGAKELIEVSQCGLLAKYNDEKDLARLIDEYISKIDQNIKLGENGRNYFQEHFTFNQYFSKLIEYLEGKYECTI